MTNELVGPADRSTDTSGPGRRRRPLPPDLLKAAANRLGVVALLGAGLWTTGTVAYHLTLRAISPGDPRWLQFRGFDWVALGCVIVSLLLFWYSRRTERDPQTILDLGLVYLIVGAFGVGMVWHLEPPPEGFAKIQPIISWIGVMVLLFAAIVPNAPGKSLVAGLLAVSMNPLSMYLARPRGVSEFDGLGDVVLMHYPDYLILGAAIVVSRVVARLGEQVSKARDLGSYQLGEVLGKGGMGVVYRASHRMLARPAAIKLIRADALASGTPEVAALAVARFRREAEAAAGLQSPHSVGLYDFGVTDEGALSIVMELLEGMTLDELVKRAGPVPANRAIHILRQVCDSLEEAHAKGMVHRDIKPANIHVGTLGLRSDFVKVLDFGLMKSVVREPAGPVLETAAGLMAGTPAFMAPEVALGDEYDGRADLYALGCVAYFLLTGALVFEGDTPMSVLAKHLSATPPAPSGRSPGPIPPELDRLVLSCLEKEPDERPRRAADLASALAAIDLPPWTEDQASAWWRDQADEPPRSREP
ncbi:MAG: serine/threonine-protein kinase [Gemmatimonadales bacterium]